MAISDSTGPDIRLLIGAVVGLVVGGALGGAVGWATGAWGTALYATVPLGIVIGLAIASRLDRQNK